MSSGPTNTDNKGSTMQSGSGGINEPTNVSGQPANKGPQKPKKNAPGGNNVKCWFCKTQGQHTTKACPQHPKNKKKGAAATPGSKPKPPSVLQKLQAENKCIYCGVQGHFIATCPVKNWGKGPEAESASQSQAGSNQDKGVEMEPKEAPQLEASQAPSSSVQTQGISAETEPPDEQSTSLPRIVPGSAVSLAQGDKPLEKKKRRGLKRNRGRRVNGVRMPYYKPALRQAEKLGVAQAEKLALEALFALEEKPIVVKRERTDSTETEEDATERSQSPPSPAIKQEIPEQTTHGPLSPAIKQEIPEQTTQRPLSPAIKQEIPEETRQWSPASALPQAMPAETTQRPPFSALKQAMPARTSQRCPSPALTQVMPAQTTERPSSPAIKQEIPEQTTEWPSLTWATPAQTAQRPPSPAIKQEIPEQTTERSPSPALTQAMSPQTTQRSSSPAIKQEIPEQTTELPPSPTLNQSMSAQTTQRPSSPAMTWATPAQTAQRPPSPAIKQEIPEQTTERSPSPALTQAMSPQTTQRSSSPAIKQEIPELTTKLPSSPALKQSMSAQTTQRPSSPAMTRAIPTETTQSPPFSALKQAIPAQTTQRCPSPAIKQAMPVQTKQLPPFRAMKPATPTQIVFKDPRPPTVHAPLRIGSTPVSAPTTTANILAKNSKPSPTSTLRRIPSPLLEMLSKPLAILLNPCADVPLNPCADVPLNPCADVPLNPCADATALPMKRKRKRRGQRKNGGTRLGNGLRKPKYKPAEARARRLAALAAALENASELERGKTDPSDATQCATSLLPSSVSTETVSAKIVSKASQPPSPGPSCTVQRLLPSQAPTKAAPSNFMPQASQPSPTPAPPRTVQGPLPSQAPTKSVPSNFVPQASQPSPSPGPSRTVQRPLPSQVPTRAVSSNFIHQASQPSPSPAPSRTVQSLPSSQAPTKAVPSNFVPQASQPLPSPAPLRTEQGPPASANFVLKASQPLSSPGPSRTVQRPLPSQAPTKAVPSNFIPQASQPSPSPASPRTVKGPPSLAKFLPKAPQPHPVPTPRIVQGSPPSPALAKSVPTSPQPYPSPVSSRPVQDPLISSAPTCVSEKIMPKALQPSLAPAPPRIMQDLPPYPRPIRPLSGKIVPKAPQPYPVPAPPRIVQDPPSSPVSTNATSAKSVPKTPQPSTDPAPSHIVQGPSPYSEWGKLMPKTPQPSPAPAPSQTVQAPPPYSGWAKLMPKAPQPSPAPAPSQTVQTPAPCSGWAKLMPKAPQPSPAPAPSQTVQAPPPYSGWAKLMPKASQPSPAPAPTQTVQAPPPYSGWAKLMPKARQPAPAPSPSHMVQSPSPSAAPTTPVSTKNVPQTLRPPVTMPSRMLEAEPLSSAPKDVESAKIEPKASQPLPISVLPSILQSSSTSPAPTKAISEKILPDAPQTPPARAVPAPTLLLQAPPSSAQSEAMPTNPQPPVPRAPLRIALVSTPSAGPTKATSAEIPPPSTVTAPPLSEPLPEPPSPPPKPSNVTTALPSKRKRKRRGIKRNRGNRLSDGTRKPHYKPKRLLEQRAALAALKEEAQELETAEKTAPQNASQKPGQAAPNTTTTDEGKPKEGKPIPTRNSAELAKLKQLKQQKQLIAKRQEEIRNQKILYTQMLKAQLALVAGNPLMSTPNIQYPGFPMPNAMVQRPPRATVPVTIVNHPNAAVQIPVPPGQNPVAPVRTLAPVSTGDQVAKETPKQPSDVNMMHHFTNINHFPAGVPRSFLNPIYQERLEQHKMEQMGLKQQEKELIKQQRKIEKAEQKVPLVMDPSDEIAEASGFVPIQENSQDADQPKAYSPSDIYGELRNESGSTEPREGSESPDPHGQKRLSAFKRLGPVTAPKKPKLTINLKCNTDQAVREVVDETEPEFVEEHTPVHLRNDVTTSTDETVMKYLYFWPWKKAVSIRRTASFKNSKSAMLLEQEQMEELYDKDNIFMQITVTNYPRYWTKENVFDVLLEQINLIPCFIEFTSHQCKFLVIRCKPALLTIHKMGFKLRKEDVELNISISVTTLTHNSIDFVPRLVLRRRLNLAYDGEGKLDLQEFTLKSDLSHFIYFPLRRLSHQTDLIQLQSVVEWERLTELNLSHNRLISIDGFHLNSTTPHLKKLDLSYNYMEKVTVLLRCRNLPLTSISLEGNPLCHDYTDPAEYVKVVRMLFPAIRELDGVAIHLKGDLPTFNKNCCLYGAENIVEKFLETFFPLLEAQPADRLLIDEMYDENALMTVLYRYKYIHRHFRISSSTSHFVDDGVKDVLEGASHITKYIHKWPGLKHDPFTFTADVLFHTDTTTVIKICGILKLISETLAEDEPVIAFSRTILLHTKDGVEYKIQNELLLWDEPSNECHDNAFQVTKIRSKKLYIDLEFESSPDEESKEKLISIFGHLTELDRNASKRCLERKEWNLRSALDNFIQLLKLNDLSSIIHPFGPPRLHL